MRFRLALSVVCLSLLAPAAHAVIKALTPLRAFLSDSQFIVIAKVEKLLPDRPGMVLTVAHDLKGKAPFRKLAVNLRGDTEAQKQKESEQLFKRLAPDLPVVLFVNHRGKRFTSFAFSNGTWFQVMGQKTEDSVAWSFTHLEPYLRRTFKGTTAEQVEIIRGSLSGKVKPPEPNPKEPPGLGPEYKSGRRKPPDDEPLGGADRSRGLRPRLASPVSGTGGRALFAVIPTIGLGAPFAILALLFPSVFGGVFVLFRRWLAFFSVVSAVSLVYLVRWLWSGSIRQTWLGTPGGLELTLLVIAFLGSFWAWRRHWVFLGTGQESDVPGRSEHVVLWSISLSCGGLMLLHLFNPFGMLEWQLLLSFAAGIWTATAYKAFRALAAARMISPALPTEGLMLGVASFFLASFAALQAGPGTLEGDSVTVAGAKAQLLEKRWSFPVQESGCCVSSPCVMGGQVYFGAAHPTFKAGTLFCLDQGTGREIWRFIDDGDLKPLFSSPFITGGSVYLGEGFHDDRDCKLYCLDAVTGKKKWEFQTTSQVESSPRVFGGKVFFGAGNDGIYCLGARSGRKIWQYPAPGHKGRLLRVGSSPTLAKGKLYAGSGVDRNATDDPGETAVFCLDMADGKLIWKNETPLPCWGAPVISGTEVFFTLGNGDVYTDAPDPAGAVLCLEAVGGKQVWRTDLPNGILAQPAVDDDHVYCGCRDGNCYCLARADGRVLWKTSLGSPVISAPVPAPSLETGASASLYVAGSRGRVCCLDPATGVAQWTYSLEQQNAFIAATPGVTVSHTIGGERRHIYVAATLGALTDGRPVLYRLNDFMPKTAGGETTNE
jgi:outer membrane protein assembly factor BamB